MFTGLIQKIGTVKRVSRRAGLVLEIGFESAPSNPSNLSNFSNLSPGESVAVNGVCLTVVKCDATRFTADVLRETESRTGLGELIPGAKVNLERALRAGDAMGGHIVQGHVDGRGKIVGRIPKGRDFQLKVSCGRVIAAQCVMKGSIAIDGVSLTISGLGENWLAVDLVPTTARDTTLGAKRIGESVNLETDVIGKYVEKWKGGRWKVEGGRSGEGGRWKVEDQVKVEGGRWNKGVCKFHCSTSNLQPQPESQPQTFNLQPESQPSTCSTTSQTPQTFQTLLEKAGFFG